MQWQQRSMYKVLFPDQRSSKEISGPAPHTFSSSPSPEQPASFWDVAYSLQPQHSTCFPGPHSFWPFRGTSKLNLFFCFQHFSLSSFPPLQIPSPLLSDKPKLLQHHRFNLAISFFPLLFMPLLLTSFLYILRIGRTLLWAQDDTPYSFFSFGSFLLKYTFQTPPPFI